MVLNALAKESPVKTIIASSYQATSGAGADGPKELMAEVDAISKGESYEPKEFSRQIAYNVIPQNAPEKPININIGRM